jgi:hypothetical protein
MRAPLILLLGLSACQASSGLTSTAALYPPPPFCTRTLGMASCFADPSALPDHPASYGDTPYRPIQPPIPWWQKIANHWND